MTFAAMLRYVPADKFGAIHAVQEITSGMSGAKLYAVTTAKGRYVLRIGQEEQAAWVQAQALESLAAAHAIAPPIVASYPDDRATLSVQILGPSFGEALSQPETRAAVITSLVQNLVKLHALPIASGRTADAGIFAQKYWGQQSIRPGFPDWALPLGDRLASWQGVLANDQRLVFSHCDLNPANLLWDGGRLWLIDWEASGRAHPYLDLATIANFLSLPADTGLDLLAAQEQGSVSSEQQAVFSACRDLVRLAYGSLFLSLIPDLNAVEFAARELTPSLSECLRQTSTGQLAMHTPAGRALIAAAFFKQIV